MKSRRHIWPSSYGVQLNLSQDSGLSSSPFDLRKNAEVDTPPPLPPKKKRSPIPDLQRVQHLDFVQTQDFLRPSRVMSSSNSSLSNDNWRNRHRHRIEAKRNSLIFSSSDDEELLQEPFPPELDFSQIVGQAEFNSSIPPPPPPRDPTRRLYLSPDSRPTSYAFEENQPDLVNPYLRPSRRQSLCTKEMRQGRAASASSYFKIPDLVQNPPSEYWKSPPFPFVPTFDPNVKSGCSTLINNAPPPRPPRPNLRKKLSNTSTDSGRGRDSAMTVISHPGGKSSPSSSSVTSRDSGCPAVPSRPLSILVEDSKAPLESEMEDVDVIELDNDPCSRSSSSPPKTNESHPGFSSKGRRSLFRKAMNEIEDVFKALEADKDLLDRAERRDLPTAHQELIAQARLDQDCATTSVNTSTENLLFSDMDNFMNWNTSSSFENIPERRQRAPSYRRSGVPDKTKDDVVFRICRSNNKPVSLGDPGVRLSQSYLTLNQDSAANDDDDPDEPNIILDDYHNRFIRDSEAAKPADLEPQFGIPKDKFCLTSGSSKNDYLHAIPDSSRYRSTFNARKHPDTVLDDLAFRTLRKDDSPDNPDQLGIIKDPNQSSHSCWQHKMESSMRRRPSLEKPSFPAVFYPKRDKKLMKALAEDMAKQIRKTSTTPDGGKSANVISYEDLLKDPDLLERVKSSLGICNEDDQGILDENDQITEEGRPRWAGKTLYQLLKTSSSSSSSSPSPPPLAEYNAVTIVQHCQLEHQPLDLSRDPGDKKQSFISSSFLRSDRPTSVLRCHERLDSGEEDEPEKLRMTSTCCQGNFASWLDNPAIMAGVYCLALLHQLGQLGGLDFLSALGVVLAMISMVSIFFL